MEKQPTTTLRKPWPQMILIWLAVFVCLIVTVAQALVWPEASGDTVLKKSGTVVDCSHAEDGYIMVMQSAGSKRYKLRIEKDGDTYTYDLNSDGNYEVFPLQLGTGTYAIKVYKQQSGSKYSQVSSQKLKVTEFTDENAAFLCPSQYVNYTADSAAVAESNSVCEGLSSDTDKLKAIHDDIIKKVQYDYILALTVEKGYLPEVDAVLAGGKGICFDYAALFACMLRVQGIPTRLVIGYADNCYHAWNEVLQNGEWVRWDLTAEASAMKVAAYTTERFY